MGRAGPRASIEQVPCLSTVAGDMIATVAIWRHFAFRFVLCLNIASLLSHHLLHPSRARARLYGMGGEVERARLSGTRRGVISTFPLHSRTAVCVAFPSPAGMDEARPGDVPGPLCGAASRARRRRCDRACAPRDSPARRGRTDWAFHLPPTRRRWGGTRWACRGGRTYPSPRTRP